MPEKAKASEKFLVIDNPSDLPLIPLDDIKDFQGDLKTEDMKLIKKLSASILNHGLFIAKAIFYEDGQVYTEDGHQTLKALRYLVTQGYDTCEVVSYKLENGRHVATSGKRYDSIMVPCQVIVPQGDTKEARFKDAAAKLLQINSQYAQFNEKTTWFQELSFNKDELDSMLATVQIPNFKPEALSGERSEYEKAFGSATTEKATYPIVRRYSEKYSAIIIVVEDEIDLVAVQEALGLDREGSYKNSLIKQTHVVSAERFLELWRSK